MKDICIAHCLWEEINTTPLYARIADLLEYSGIRTISRDMTLVVLGAYRHLKGYTYIGESADESQPVWSATVDCELVSRC